MKDNNEYYKKLEKENWFRYKGMSEKERDDALELLYKCKDICETEIPIAGVKKCRIIEMKFERTDFEVIEFTGSLLIGNQDIQEARNVIGCIAQNSDGIEVYMDVERINAKDEPIVYSVVDKFIKQDNNFIRESKYTYESGKKIH